MTVYFIRREGDPKGLVKVGYARSMPQRMAALQTGMPEKLEILAVMKGSISDEREIHKALAADRVSGEWFRPSDKLQAFIDAANAEEAKGLPPAVALKRPIPTIEETIGSKSVVDVTIAYVADLIDREHRRSRSPLYAARDKVADQIGIPRTYLKHFWDRWRTMSDCSGNLYAAVSWAVAHHLELEGRLTPELASTLRWGRERGYEPPVGFRAVARPDGRLDIH